MSAPMSIAELIAQHRTLYDRRLQARNEVWRQHEAFDPDFRVDQPGAIKEALQAKHGAGAASTIERYAAAEQASTEAAEFEDRAWVQIAAARPTTAPDLRLWLDYLIEHSRREDEVVTLRRALEHVSGMLVERLAA